MNEQKARLISTLRLYGVQSARELTEKLGVSQPTLSRMLATLSSSRLHRIGRVRSTRYAWRREIDGATLWPLYRLDEAGESHRVATLYLLEGGQWHVNLEESWPALEHPMFASGLYPDWPWFLEDLCPRGFLGRLFARACAEHLSLPSDPREWSAVHTLRALTRMGYDAPGAFVIGEEMLSRARTQAPDAADLNDTLLLMKARTVLEGEWPGSSAAGEQPKFTLKLGAVNGSRRDLLVKFSGDESLPDQSRRADLLRAEHLANRILSDHGIPAARSELRCVEGRTFLISDRFDRTETGGRRAVVSLHVLNAAFGDVNRSWIASGDDLLEQGWIDAPGAERLGIVWAFGQLIGNTDMHDGNASFFLTSHAPFTPTPVYDMCPMGLSPRADGTLPDRLPTLSPPPPEQQRHFNRARSLAELFYESVVKDTGFTPAFREAFEVKM